MGPDIERTQIFRADRDREDFLNRLQDPCTLRQRGIKVASDERVLRDGEFIQRLLSEAEEKEKQTLRLSRKVLDLVTLTKRIVKGEWIEERE